MVYKIYIGKNAWNADKNKNGLQLLLTHGFLENIENVDEADIILYTSDSPISCGTVQDINIFDNRYKDKVIILGPHFSVFPTKFIHSLDSSRNGNIAFNQLSTWNCERWKKDVNHGQGLHLVIMPFPVDTEMFKPSDKEKDCIMIYTKKRIQADYQFIIDYMTVKGYNIKFFDYEKKYDEKDYMDVLQRASFAIWIGCHESQGFALQEALSSDVPLLVFGVTEMSQETGQENNMMYKREKATSISYWDERCGEHFSDRKDFFDKFATFTEKVQSKAYKPREFVLENLSARGVFTQFWEPTVETIREHMRYIKMII